MFEHKHKGILPLNLKKLAKRADNLKIILILQNDMLLLMLFCKCVLKQREEFILFWEQYVLRFSVKIAYLKIL